MSNSMDDRQKGFETKFAMDQQTQFKVEARASKLAGLWAANLMGMKGDDAEAYAKEVVASNLEEPGFEDVKRKLKADLNRRGIEASDRLIDSELEICVDKAREQIAADQAK